MTGMHIHIFFGGYFICKNHFPRKVSQAYSNFLCRYFVLKIYGNRTGCRIGENLNILG